MIKAAIFDIGNVLITHSLGSIDFCNELGIDKERYDEFINKWLTTLGLGEINEDQYWSQFAEEFTVAGQNASKDLFIKAFASSLEINQEMPTFIRKLKGKGLRLAVLSNTIPSHADHLLQLGVYTGFDEVYLSYEVGLRKPDLR